MPYTDHIPADPGMNPVIQNLRARAEILRRQLAATEADRDKQGVSAEWLNYETKAQKIREQLAEVEANLRIHLAKEESLRNAI